MRSTFGGLNIANTGLFIAQRQLDVTAHNVANANVDGYSRQRYVNSAMPAMGWRVQMTSPLRGKEGGGVETLSLDQIRDVFLDRQFRNEQTKSSYWETRSKSLYYVEDVFNSIDTNSLDGVMSAFFNSMQELSKNPTDEAIRTNVVAQAKKLADVFHLYDTQLTDLMEQQNYNLIEKTKHTNNLLTQLTALNENIFRFELGGSVANDMRDKRALILDELSSLMDITYSEVSFEPPMHNIYGLELTRLQVYAGGYAGEDYEDMLLVSHLDAHPLGIRELEPGENEIYDTVLGEKEITPPFVQIVLTGPDTFYNEDFITDFTNYSNTGIDLLPVRENSSSDGIAGYIGGQLQSYLDVRDGNSMEKTGIPYFLSELNRMVEVFVTTFNSIHGEGEPMPNSYEGGTDFFNADGLTARSISVDESILASPSNIRASSEPVSIDAEGHQQTGNNENVLRLIRAVKEGIGDDAGDLVGEIGSLEGFYKNFLGMIASETASSNGMEASQNVLLTGIQTQRDAISSVSEEEETTNMIRFQHAYNAASRCITTIDEMLDKLINGTGRVGM